MARPNLILGAAVAVIAALAVVAAVVAGSQPEPTSDPTTPDGVVLNYVRALLERDTESAAAALSPSLGCDASDLAASYTPNAARVVLVETTEEDSTARVTVEISVSGGDGPFGGGEYTSRETFELEQGDNTWLIAGSPWPVYFCERGA